jgi:hypothetical protein
MPDIYAERWEAMTPDERAQIRAIITNGLYLKFLRIVECRRPSSILLSGGADPTKTDEHTMIRAGIRLAEQRGWDLHIAAIYLALNEPAEIKGPAEETFPSAGRVDRDWDTLPPFPKLPDTPLKKKRQK